MFYVYGMQWHQMSSYSDYFVAYIIYTHQSLGIIFVPVAQLVQTYNSVSKASWTDDTSKMLALEYLLLLHQKRNMYEHTRTRYTHNSTACTYILLCHTLSLTLTGKLKSSTSIFITSLWPPRHARWSAVESSCVCMHIAKTMWNVTEKQIS